MRFPSRHRSFVVLTVAVLCAPAFHGGRALGAPSEPEVSVSLAGHAVTIPMTISNGQIAIVTEVNGTPLTFILDSGAQLNFLSSSMAKSCGVKAVESDETMVVSGTGGQVSLPSSWARIDSLKVGGALFQKGGGAEVHQSAAVLMDLPPQFHAQGMLGYNFLRHFVTTIDYQTKTVTFRDAPPPAGGATVLPFVLNGNIPSVEIDMDGVQGRFQIDTGDGGSIDINRPFAERGRLFAKYPRHLDMIGGLGVGGETRSRVIRVQTLTMGNQKVQNLIGYISLQQHGAFADSKSDGSLGFDVLSRFRVTLDYPSKRILLENVHGPDHAQNYNRSGVGFSISGAAPAVTDIVPGGPGEVAGVKRGDEVVEVNGTPIDSLSVMILSQAFRGSPGSRVALKLRAPDKTVRNITLTLRELL